MDKETDRGLEKLYNELRFIQERRSKLSIMKIAFVAGFFGIGSVKLGSNTNDMTQAALYLVPLIAVLFDIFGIASTISIRKLETFLEKEARDHNNNDILTRWHDFSRRHRLPSRANFWSHVILTFLAFAVPIGLLLMRDGLPTDLDACQWKLKVSYFVIIAGLWGCFRRLERCAKTHLAQELEPSSG